MIKGAIKAWTLNLKTCLLSAFLQSLEKLFIPWLGLKVQEQTGRLGKEKIS